MIGFESPKMRGLLIGLLSFGLILAPNGINAGGVIQATTSSDTAGSQGNNQQMNYYPTSPSPSPSPPPPPSPSPSPPTPPSPYPYPSPSPPSPPSPSPPPPPSPSPPPPPSPSPPPPPSPSPPPPSPSPPSPSPSPSPPSPSPPPPSPPSPSPSPPSPSPSPPPTSPPPPSPPICSSKSTVLVTPIKSAYGSSNSLLMDDKNGAIQVSVDLGCIVPPKQTCTVFFETPYSPFGKPYFRFSTCGLKYTSHLNSPQSLWFQNEYFFITNENFNYNAPSDISSTRVTAHVYCETKEVFTQVVKVTRTVQTGGQCWIYGDPHVQQYDLGSKEVSGTVQNMDPGYFTVSRTDRLVVQSNYWKCDLKNSLTCTDATVIRYLSDIIIVTDKVYRISDSLVHLDVISYQDSTNKNSEWHIICPDGSNIHVVQSYQVTSGGKKYSIDTTVDLPPMYQDKNYDGLCGTSHRKPQNISQANFDIVRAASKIQFHSNLNLMTCGNSCDPKASPLLIANENLYPFKMYACSAKHLSDSSSSGIRPFESCFNNNENLSTPNNYISVTKSMPKFSITANFFGDRMNELSPPSRLTRRDTAGCGSSADIASLASRTCTAVIQDCSIPSLDFSSDVAACIQDVVGGYSSQSLDSFHFLNSYQHKSSSQLSEWVRLNASDSNIALSNKCGLYSSPCPNSCSQNGYCSIAGCICSPGFAGMDCSQALTCDGLNKVATQSSLTTPYSNTTSTSTSSAYSLVTSSFLTVLTAFACIAITAQ